MKHVSFEEYEAAKAEIIGGVHYIEKSTMENDVIHKTYAAVADWIYQRIPAVLKLLFTSSDIEKMIEAALEEAKKAWGANENLKGYIDTPSVESLLVGIEEQAVQTEPAEN